MDLAKLILTTIAGQTRTSQRFAQNFGDPRVPMRESLKTYRRNKKLCFKQCLPEANLSEGFKSTESIETLYNLKIHCRTISSIV